VVCPYHLRHSDYCGKIRRQPDAEAPGAIDYPRPMPSGACGERVFGGDLLVPQGNHWVHSHSPARREPCRREGDGQQYGYRGNDGGRVVRADAE
jgi:hypothetical protein